VVIDLLLWPHRLTIRERMRSERRNNEEPPRQVQREKSCCRFKFKKKGEERGIRMRRREKTEKKLHTHSLAYTCTYTSLLSPFIDRYGIT
jgi:hypothetical protein